IEKNLYGSEKMDVIRKSFIFDKIPGKLSSHSVSLCKINEKEILAFWFAGTWEGNKDVDLFTSRYNILEGSWESPKLFVQDPVRSLGNTCPVLFDNKIRVYYVAMEGKNWTETSLWYKESYDQGTTWTQEKPFSLVNNNLLFGTKLLKLRDNRYVFPIYNEKMWISTPYISNDIQRNKWKKFGEIQTEKGNIQQDMVEIKNHIFSLLRTRDGYIYKTTYDLERKEWDKPKSTGIPNPNSRVALEKIGNLLVCCCNPLGLEKGEIIEDPRKLSNLEDPFWGKREKLSIFTSYDFGNTWHEEIILENSKNKEYSYPWIQIISESELMVAYTYERRNIAYTIIKI
ncbi:exo-alpha-sialidase, partial [Petrotoga halophila]